MPDVIRVPRRGPVELSTRVCTTKKDELMAYLEDAKVVRQYLEDDHAATMVAMDNAISELESAIRGE